MEYNFVRWASIVKMLEKSTLVEGGDWSTIFGTTPGKLTTSQSRANTHGSRVKYPTNHNIFRKGIELSLNNFNICNNSNKIPVV